MASEDYVQKYSLRTDAFHTSSLGAVRGHIRLQAFIAKTPDGKGYLRDYFIEHENGVYKDGYINTVERRLLTYQEAVAIIEKKQKEYAASYDAVDETRADYRKILQRYDYFDIYSPAQAHRRMVDAMIDAVTGKGAGHMRAPRRFMPAPKKGL